MAALVYAAESYEEIYQSVCDAAVRLVDGCDHASLMLMRHGKPWTAAASDDIAALIDQFERELNDGPCLDAINDESAFVDTDLTDGSPWPTLHGRVLAETPVRGMAGFRLVDGEKKTGALDLFSDTPGALRRRRSTRRSCSCRSSRSRCWQPSSSTTRQPCARDWRAIARSARPSD